MDADRILKFLRDLMSNNNREWFLANKSEYKDVRESFEQGVAGAIARIATFDPSVAHLTVKDATRAFPTTSRLTRIILEHISPPTARSRCMADTTYILNRTTVLWPVATIGFPPTSLRPAVMR